MKVNTMNKYYRTAHNFKQSSEKKITTVKDKNYINKAIQILLLKLFNHLFHSFMEDIFQELFFSTNIKRTFLKHIDMNKLRTKSKSKT